MEDIDVAPFVVGTTPALDPTRIAGRMVLRITGGGRASVNNQQRIQLHTHAFEVPWVPPKGVLRTLMAAWGSNARHWVGRCAEVYAEQDCAYGGQRVPGVRLCGLSHIDKPFKAMMRESNHSESGIKARYRTLRYPIRVITPDEVQRTHQPADAKPQQQASAVTPDMLARCIKAFAARGITQQALEQRIDKTVEAWTLDDLRTLSTYMSTLPGVT